MIKCPICERVMREFEYNYRCIKCGARINKDQIDVSPKVPVNLYPNHRDTPNMAGLFWLLYIAGFVLGLFFLLVWLNECNIFNFIGGI